MAQGECAYATKGNRFLGAAALSAQPFARCGRDPYVDVPPLAWSSQALGLRLPDAPALHRVVTFLDELASQATGRSAAAA